MYHAGVIFATGNGHTKMCPSLTSTTQKQHVCQTGLILHWNVVGMEGERFILRQFYKNIKFLEATKHKQQWGTLEEQLCKAPSCVWSPSRDTKGKSTRFWSWLILATACSCTGACALVENTCGVERPVWPFATMASTLPLTPAGAMGSAAAAAMRAWSRWHWQENSLGVPRTQRVLTSPTSGVFPPLGPGTLASTGTQGDTRC